MTAHSHSAKPKPDPNRLKAQLDPLPFEVQKDSAQVPDSEASTDKTLPTVDKGKGRATGWSDYYELPARAKQAEQHVLNATQSVRREAEGYNVALSPNEDRQLQQVDHSAQAAVLHYLQQLDDAKKALDMAQENARFAQSRTNIFDRRKSARERSNQALKIFEEAKQKYEDLLDSARSIGSHALRARNIHAARLKFAELEAQLRGRDVFEKEAHTLDTKPAHNLTRQEQTRKEFLKAKKEYIELRARVIGVHLQAFLHEQSVLADARMLELLKVKRGEHVKGLDVRAQAVTEMPYYSKEKAFGMVYRLYEAAQNLSWSKLFGLEPGEIDDSQTTVKSGILARLTGQMSRSDSNVSQNPAPHKIADVLRKPNLLATLSAEQIEKYSDAELKQLFLDLSTRAHVNGKKLAEMPGYAVLSAKIQERNHLKYQRMLPYEDEDPSPYRRIKQALEEILGKTSFAWQTKQRIVNNDTYGAGPNSRAGMVVAALGCLALGGSGEMIGSAHAQEAAPQESTETVQETEVGWHRLPDENGHRSQPTGLFEDECLKAAQKVDNVSFTQHIRNADSLLQRGIDTTVEKLGVERAPSPDDQTTPMAREQHATESRLLRNQLTTDAAEQQAVWEAPQNITAETIAVAQEEMRDGRMQLPNGIIVEFKSQSDGYYDITLPYVAPLIVAQRALLRGDYKEIIERSVKEVNPGRYTVEFATAKVEYLAVRLNSLLEVRDYMRDHGLSDTAQYQALREEMDAIVLKINGFGHVIYDDPYAGNLANHWEIEEYSDWRTPKITVVTVTRAPNLDYNPQTAIPNTFVEPEPLP